MSGLILTLAGSMFMIPMLILIGIYLVADTPGWLLRTGLWTMAFSFLIGSIGILYAMCEMDQENRTRS